MSRLVFVFVLGLALAVGACKSTAPASPPAIDHTSKPLSPVQLSWQELSREPTKAELRATVVRLAPLTFPLEVSLQLPPGAALAAGRARFTLPPNAEAATDVEAVTVTYPATPKGDLLLAADGQAIDVGIHARLPYRFGRPAPQHEVVAPTGPELKLGERNLGPSVPIKPE